MYYPSFSSSIHKKLFVFIIVLFGAGLSQYYGVVLVKGMSTISNEEEALEVERQLQSLNKTPIKSIQTENGHIIDCVDIYKQPAFDHPLLKNHRIQMRPRFNPQGHNSSSTTDHENNKRREVVLQRMGCPKGSVPIRRTSKEDLIRAQAFTESYPASIYTGPPSSNVAIVRTKSNTGQKFYGLQAYLNPQNPVVSVDQSSSSQFWIESGASVRFNSLQAGWIVSPSLYNDSNTHLFGFWRVDGPLRGGCFDTLCNGFVQVDKDYHIGSVVTPTSYYGEPDPVELKVGIYLDTSTGNWWLTILKNDVHIGYWPKDLLPSLSDGSTDISFGGQTKGNMVRQSPMMGNGHFPTGGEKKEKFSYGCYMSTLKVFTGGRTWEDPLDSILEEHTDNERCYGVDYYGYVSHDFQCALQFGGPGGIC